MTSMHKQVLLFCLALLAAACLCQDLLEFDLTPRKAKEPAPTPSTVVRDSESTILDQIIPRKPASFQLETTFPDSHRLVVGDVYDVYLWPKSSNGKPSVVSFSRLNVEVDPSPEVVEIRVVQVEDASCFHLQIVPSTKQEAVGIAFLVDDKRVGEPIVFSTDGTPDLSLSLVTSPNGVVVAGDSAVVDIRLRDALGDMCEGFEGVLIESEKMSQLQTRLKYYQRGVAHKEIEMRTTTAGDYILNVLYDGKPIKGSPITLTFHANTLELENAQVMGLGTWVAQYDAIATIYVRLADGYGNLWDLPEVSPTESDVTVDGERVDGAHNGDCPVQTEMRVPTSPEDIQSWNDLFSSVEMTVSGVADLSLDYLPFRDSEGHLGIDYLLRNIGDDMEHGLQQQLKLELSIAKQNVTSLFIDLHFGKRLLPLPPYLWNLRRGPCPALPLGSQCPLRQAGTLPAVRTGKKGMVKVGWGPGQLAAGKQMAVAAGEFSVVDAGRYILACEESVDHYTIDEDTQRHVGGTWNAHNLSEGSHLLSVSLSSAARDNDMSFSCRFEHYTGPLRVYGSSVRVANLVSGVPQGPLQVAVTVSNLGVAPISDLTARLALASSIVTVDIAETEIIHQNRIQDLLLDITVSEDAELMGSFVLPIALTSETHNINEVVHIRVKNRFASASFKFAFHNDDGSLSVAVAVPPTLECPESGCPVVVVLQGGSLKSAAAQFTPRANAWLLFPAKRSTEPFRWGSADDATVMSALAGLTAVSVSWPEAPANSESVLFVGPHIGGEGALRLSLQHPDIVLAAAIGSSWVPLDPLFSDATLPESLGVPSSKGDYLSQLPALESVPVLLLVGDAEMHSYPWEASRALEVFRAAGVDVRMGRDVAVPRSKVPHAIVKETQELRQFIDENLAVEREKPENFRALLGGGAAKSTRGISVIRRISPEPSIVAGVEVGDDLWLTTSNVAAVKLVGREESSVVIDGSTINFPSGLETACREKGSWEPCEPIGDNYDVTVAAVLHGEVTIAYGTQSTPSVTGVYRKAAVTLANRLFQEVGTKCIIKRDIDLTGREIDSLVLLGGPRTNSAAAAVLNGSSVEINENGATLGDCYAGSHSVGLLLVAGSHWGSRATVVLAASDLATFLTGVDMLSADCTVPHYLVYGSAWRTMGSRATIATGHLSQDWQYVDTTARKLQCQVPAPTADNATGDALW